MNTCVENRFPYLLLTRQAEAQIVLGDRPVEVTLQRAWEALSFKEKADLAGTLVALAIERAGLRESGVKRGAPETGGGNAEEKVR